MGHAALEGVVAGVGHGPRPRIGIEQRTKWTNRCDRLARCQRPWRAGANAGNWVIGKWRSFAERIARRRTCGSVVVDKQTQRLVRGIRLHSADQPMPLVANITHRRHSVRTDLPLYGKFVVFGVRKLVLGIKGPVVRERFNLSPGKRSVWVAW